jgi:hypothetical protein
VRVACSGGEMVGAAGIEPATTGLENRCSIQLSYAPLSKIYHKHRVEYHAVSH